MAVRWCVECRWFDLDLRPEMGSRYLCLRSGERLPADPMNRPACSHFARPVKVPHWGP